MLLIRLFFIPLSILLVFCTSVVGQTTSFVAGPLLPDARMWHQTESLPNGKLLIMGGDSGHDDVYIYNNSCILYNYETNAYEAAASMNVKRSNFMTVRLNDGNILAIGGDNDTDVGMKSCEIYNSTTGVWTLTGSLNSWHWGGRAVKLNDGKILVAGGFTNEACEVYDPYTQQWSYTGSMILSHGRGMSLTLMNDGKVLAAGGEEQQQTLEIFSPLNNTWTKLAATLNRNHFDHGAVKMNDGKIMIAGSTSISLANATSAELFDPNTKTVTTLGNLLQPAGSNQLMLLDNGNVLTFGFGDLTAPGNTKIFQEYITSSNQWVTSTYNASGSIGYTFNRLANGKFFLVGGTFAGTQSAKFSMIITQNGYGACAGLPDLNLAVTDVTTGGYCYGKGVTIRVDTPPSTCYVYIGENRIGSFFGGGAFGTYTIPADYLKPGTHVISVKAKQTGCVTVELKQTVKVTIDRQNTTTTSISLVSASTFLCNSSSQATFQVDNPVTGTYRWYNGATGTQINMNEFAQVYAYHVDASGCYGPPSDSIEVRSVSASDLTTSADKTLCVTASPIQLVGLPAGGTWTGTGVSASGLFTPSAAGGTGYKVATYNLCGYTKTQAITLEASNVVTLTASDYNWVIKDTLCGGDFIPIYTYPTAHGYSFLLYVNGQRSYESYNTDYDPTLYYYPGTETSVTLSLKAFKTTPSASCPKDTGVITRTYGVYPKPSASTQVIIPESSCNDRPLTIKIVHPQKGVVYSATYGSQINQTDRPYAITYVDVDTLIIVSKPWANGTNPDGMFIYQKAAASCSSDILLASKTISRVIYSASIDAGSVFYVGQPVDVRGFSLLQNVQWVIDGVTYNNSTVPIFTYNVVGKHTYRMITTGGSCYTSFDKEVNIVNPTPKVTQDICLFNSYHNNTPYTIYKSLTDHSGNVIDVGANYEPNWGDSPGGERGFVYKYNKNGQKLWSIDLNFNGQFTTNDFKSLVVSSIACDPSNNLYITGTFTARAFSFGSVNINYGALDNPYSHCFIAKINEAGQIGWFIFSSDNTNSHAYADNYYDPTNRGIGAADIKYDQGKVYVSARLMGQTIWTNDQFTPLNITHAERIKDYAILEINASSGNQLNVLASITEGAVNSNNYLLAQNKAAETQGARIVITSPNIEVTNDHKVLVYGKIVNTVSFGSIAVTSPTVNNLPSYSEFTGLIDPSVGDWQSVTLESAFDTHYTIGLEKKNAVYNSSRHKFSFINRAMGGPLDPSIYLDAYNGKVFDPYQVHIKVDANNSLSMPQGALLKSIDENGNVLWKKKLTGGNPEYIFLSKDESQIIVAGVQTRGIFIDPSNDNRGLAANYYKPQPYDNNYNDDLFAIGFDAQTGDVLWSEKVGDEEITDFLVSAVLSDCGDLVLTGTNFYGHAGVIKHESHSITSEVNSSYQIRIPTSGICNNTNCTLENGPTVTSTQDAEENKAQVVFYPNPANKEVHAKTESGNLFYKVELKDLQGRTLKTIDCNGDTEASMRVDEIPSGIYLMEATMSNGSVVNKLYITR